ncbi:DUF2165 family protein [Enterobacterales bacterium AE_CKDN230030158-1A_HGKHYDSX7]
MDTHLSLTIFLAVHTLGFSLWLSIALINNLHAFAGSVGAIGATLSMAPLRQAPAIDTPLLARALADPRLARLALAFIVLLQMVAVATAWTGCYHLLLGEGLEPARAWLNLAASAALAFLFAMLLGGLWFGYWIRQEGLQLTHLLLVVWVLAGFVVVNGRWV